MLLIFPPVAKACEPPAGIARLAAVLNAHQIPCRMLDANLEGLLWLIGQQPAVADTWTRRAWSSRTRHLDALRKIDTYRHPARYARAVSDLNRLLAVAGSDQGISAGLADYQDTQLSPLRSSDLCAAADNPSRNLFYPWFSERLTELLEADGERIVGFSLNYLNQALCTFAMIGFLRSRFPGLTIVLGGGLVTSWLRSPGWRNPFDNLVDHLIDGPGELPLLALHGIELRAAPAAPCYDGLPLHDYLSPGLILPYSAAGGCWWNRCSFCPERAEGNSYLPVPTNQVLADLHLLTRHYQPALIHLLDNAISPALLRGLADDPPGAPWYGFSRFGRELADPEFCVALQRSGCVMLKLGLESGDQEVLDRLHKGIELGMVEQILANLHEAGIGTYIYLLFGTPAEDEAAARRTLEFVTRNHHAVDFLNLALFNMPSGGDEAGEYEPLPFYDGDLTLYAGFRHPLGWDRGRVRQFLEREFKRHPAIAPILRNDPPLFTSNHAPLRVMQ